MPTGLSKSPVYLPAFLKYLCFPMLMKFMLDTLVDTVRLIGQMFSPFIHFLVRDISKSEPSQLFYNPWSHKIKATSIGANQSIDFSSGSPITILIPISGCWSVHDWICFVCFFCVLYFEPASLSVTLLKTTRPTSFMKCNNYVCSVHLQWFSMFIHLRL